MLEGHRGGGADIHRSDRRDRDRGGERDSHRGHRGSTDFSDFMHGSSDRDFEPHAMSSALLGIFT